MPYLKLENFSGISPRTSPTELAPNQAQTARNVKLQSGDIRAWRKPTAVYTNGLSDTHTIYNLENTTLGTNAWLEFSTDVNVVPGPVADTTDFRVYYTDGVAPRKTNWALATTSGTGTKPFPIASAPMGVPNPTAAATLAKAGGISATTEDRVYVYTYVNTFGAVLEESGPSPAATITAVKTDDTVTVSGFATAPTSASGYNINAIRIYRSVYGTATASYLYVGQVTVNPATGVAAGTLSDTVKAAALGVPLPSLYYLPPPATLQNLIAMPNGIMAGFTGNQVWFSEPYLPHAWPTQYMMTVGAPIVGLGVFGQTLVVCTTQSPYLITGSTPGAMSQEKVPLPEPCVSKLSIVGDQYGVLYASPNGIVSIAPGTQDVISRALFTRDEWQTYLPSGMVGVIYQNMYMLFYRVGETRAALVITRGDNPPLITLDADAQAVFVQRSTANIFMVSSMDNKIYQLDSDPVNNLFYEWKSKKFVLPEPTSFGAMKLQADWTYISDAAAYAAAYAEVVAANQAFWASGNSLQSTLGSVVLGGVALGDSDLDPLPSQPDVRNVQVIVNADNAQLFAQGMTSQEPVRLPAANKNYVYEVKITGNAPVRQFRMATSIGELRQV